MYVVKGKNVLITGAASGIGKELSLLFAQDGANLVLNDMPQKKAILDEWAGELKSRFNAHVWTFGVNLAEDSGAETLYKSSVQAAGRIDILVNDAGTLTYGKFTDTDYQKQDFMVKTNALAVFRLTRLALPGMLTAGDGRVLNMSSCSAFQPTVYHAAYGASKAFVQSMSEAINAEIKGTGVKVLTLSPPYTKTPLLKDADMPEKMLWYKISGLWYPAVIAAIGYKSFKSGKTICIPGPMNWLMHSIVVRLSPHNMLNAISLQAMKRQR